MGYVGGSSWGRDPNIYRFTGCCRFWSQASTLMKNNKFTELQSYNQKETHVQWTAVGALESVDDSGCFGCVT